jgi:hypothetical protein
MSKIGTKHGAMVCDPVKYLKHFGETENLSENDAALAEQYLVRLWAGARSNTTGQTFDQLRVENYIGASGGIEAIPPTSSEIRGHIKRGAFLVHKTCQLLATAAANESDARLQPSRYGWEEHFGTLLPSKCMKPLPRSLLTTCECAGKCKSRRYGCRSAGVVCNIFCHGKTDTFLCKNKTK